MNQIIPTKDHARKILELISHGLVREIGNPVPGQMCVEAAVCFALGLPHGDNPPCIAQSVRIFKIALNDSDWSSNFARAKGLRQLAIAQLGSNEIDESVFAKELALAVIRKIVPIALRSAAGMHGCVPEHDAKLEACAKLCESSQDLSAASYAASAAASDEVLSIVAECAVGALIRCKSPGCEWLDLCGLKEAE